MASNNFCLDRQLIRSLVQGVERHIRGQTAHLEHNAPGTNHRHPVFHVTFTLTHPSLWGFLSIGFVRENPDPYLTAAFHLAHQSATRGFDLAGSHPPWLKRLQAKFAVQEFCPTQSQAQHVAALLLAPLY